MNPLENRETNMNNKQTPIHQIRIGAIKAAIWENKSEKLTRYSVTLERLYKSDGDWSSSASFGRDDLPLISKISDQVHTWIFARQQENKTQSV